MKKKLRLAIQKAIYECDIKTLSTFPESDIEGFQFIPKGASKAGLEINALFYAVMVADLDTVKQIIKIVKGYYKAVVENFITFSSEEKAEFNGDMEKVHAKAINEFLQPFFSCVLEGEFKYDAVTIAELREYKKLVRYLRSEFQAVDLETITPIKPNERKKAFQMLMKKLGGSYSGWHSKSKKIKYSPPRSFAGERERQLLKQLSTVLYFHLEHKKIKKLVEVEMMHLTYDEKHFLVVAANETNVSKHFPKTANALQKALINPQTGERQGERKKRLDRYTEKIRKRVYYAGNKFEFNHKNDTDEDKENFYAIVELLRKKTKPNVVQLTYKDGVDWDMSQPSRENLQELFDGDSNQIILLDTSSLTASKQKKRHAEEFLTDVAEVANSYAAEQDKTSRTAVAGKMRPCITCMGRMTGRITLFGKHPGKAYATRYYEQEKWASVRSLVYMTKPVTSWITAKNKKGMNKQPSYDSASDSDSEGRCIRRP